MRLLGIGVVCIGRGVEPLSVPQTDIPTPPSRYPEVDSLVMVQVKQIQEMGAYVKLVSRVTATERV